MEQQEMSFEVVDAEVVTSNDNAVTLTDDGKAFGIATKCKDAETLFLNKDNFLPLLREVKKIARGLVADVHTSEGVKQRKAMNTKLAKLKTYIEDEGKKVAAELKAKPKMVDATRKAVKDTLEQLQEEVMAPVKEILKRKDEIVEISNIPAMAIGCNSMGCQQVLEEIESHVHDEAYWDESYKEACDAIREAKRQVEAMKAGAEKAEAEQRELEQLRQQKAEFERMEREKAEAAQRAAEAEVLKAKQEAENARREAEEAKARAEAAEALTKVDCGEADAEKTRGEMLFPDDEKEYRRMVNREVLEDLKSYGMDEDTCKRIITDIVHGKVRHLRLMY